MIMKALDIVFICLLASAAFVQLDDPDGWLWCLLYAAPIVIVGTVALQHIHDRFLN